MMHNVWHHEVVSPNTFIIHEVEHKTYDIIYLLARTANTKPLTPRTIASAAPVSTAA